MQDPDDPVTSWVAIVVLASIVLLYSNNYTFIERVATVLVALFSAMTVAIALGLPFSPFPYTADQLLSSLRLAIPIDAIGAAVAMFGITCSWFRSAPSRPASSYSPWWWRSGTCAEVTFRSSCGVAYGSTRCRLSSVAIAVLWVYTTATVFGLKIG